MSESTLQDVEYITEQNEDGKKNYKIKGVFMQADIKNKNGRVYPMEILQKEVKRYNKEFINEKRAYGELGHPEGPTVNLERASHMITALYPDGKNYIGEAKVLSTPMGEIVKSFAEIIDKYFGIPYELTVFVFPFIIIAILIWYYFFRR